MHLEHRLPRGLWLPCDFYCAISLTRDRLLVAPTVLYGSYGASGGDRKHALGFVRLELWLLLHVCIIVDLRRL